MAVYDVRSARGAFVPSLRLSAGISNYYYRHFGSTNLPYSEQMDLNFGQYVGVTLSIPLFSGLSQITTLKKAKNRRLDTQLAYDDRLQELRISIEQAVIDCRNLSKEAVKMEEKAVSDSIAYTFAKRKYKEGLMSFLDMQQTANTWYESQAELLKTRLLLGVKRRLLDYYRTNTLIGK
jgi:outer membrane protein